MSIADDRYAAATAIYNAGQERAAKNPAPVGQKFPSGTRVQISDDAPWCPGEKATVLYTHGQAYGWGKNYDSYSLLVDGCKSGRSWFREKNLTRIEGDAYECSSKR